MCCACAEIERLLHHVTLKKKKNTVFKKIYILLSSLSSNSFYSFTLQYVWSMCVIFSTFSLSFLLYYRRLVSRYTDMSARRCLAAYLHGLGKSEERTGRELRIESPESRCGRFFTYVKQPGVNRKDKQHRRHNMWEIDTSARYSCRFLLKIRNLFRKFSSGRYIRIPVFELYVALPKLFFSNLKTLIFQCASV